jgi:iron complex transport system substrate-binding protein
VGAALGRAEQAGRLVAGYQALLDRLHARTAAQPTQPRVAVLEWLDPLMGAGNWTPELVALAGGFNLFGKVGAHSPWLTWQELAAADPDAIILTPCGFSLERTLQDLPLLEAHPAWGGLQAVRAGRVFAVDGNQYFNRSGPRLVESAEILAVLLFGEEVVGKEITERLNHTSWQQIAR